MFFYDYKKESIFFIMKNYYLGILFISAFLFSEVSVSQIRITEVNLSDQKITVKNFGGSTVDISSYWTCSRFGYGELSGMTIVNGDFNLEGGEEVEFSSSVDLNTTSADLGIYSSRSFGSSAAMVDFLQWGAGGIGRESVAVTKGIWNEGDFISVTAPYKFTGESLETGVSFWETAVLSIEEKDKLSFSIYPNPSSDYINIVTSELSNLNDVIIYDFTGKIIKIEKFNNTDSIINIEDLKAGNYFLKLVSDNKIGFQKIIKK